MVPVGPWRVCVNIPVRLWRMAAASAGLPMVICVVSKPSANSALLAACGGPLPRPALCALEGVLPESLDRREGASTGDSV